MFTTRSLSSLVAALFLASPLLAQEVAIQPNQPQAVSANLSPESLKELLAPIALYPDAMIALMLPASTVPSDIVLANRYVSGKGDPATFSAQPWDKSVQSLASYPDVLSWMDQNLEWTTSLGQAFISQPADVMNAIQALRAQAQAAGNLVDTPQQVIVKEKSIIRIVPAEPEYIYVPQYDPQVVYVQQYQPNYAPLLTFGIGFAVGSWLNYDCDWDRRSVYYGDWQPGWNYRHNNWNNNGNWNNNNGNWDNNNGGGNNINVNNNNVNVVNINQSTAQQWQPSNRSRQQVARQQENYVNANGRRNRNAQTTDLAANATDQNNRHVPRPSRINLADNDNVTRNKKREAALQTGAPGTVPAANGDAIVNGKGKNNRNPNNSAINPTTPPDVAGQKGKPLRNPNNVNPDPNAVNADPALNKKQAKKANDMVPAPANPGPNQVATDPSVSGADKKQQRRSGQVPTTTQAPVLNSSGNPAANSGGSAKKQKGNQPAVVSQPPALTSSDTPSNNGNVKRQKSEPQPQSSQSSQPSKKANRQPQEYSQPAPSQPQQQKKQKQQSQSSYQPQQQPKQQQKHQQQQSQPQPQKQQKQQSAPQQSNAPKKQQQQQNKASNQSQPQKSDNGKKSDKKKDKND